MMQTWMRVTPLPVADWMPGPLRQRAEEWNARLGKLLEERAGVENAVNQLDFAESGFLDQVEQLRRRHLQAMRHFVLLLEEGVPLAEALEAAWREAKEVARRRQAEVDALVRERLKDAGFDVIDGPPHSELAGAFVRVIASHPMAREATQKYLDIAENPIHASSSLRSLLKTARAELQEATSRATAML